VGHRLVFPQGHRSVSVSRHSFCSHRSVAVPCENGLVETTVAKGGQKPGCRIVGSHTRWELTTWADFQLCLHRLLMSSGCKSSHSGFLDVVRGSQIDRIDASQVVTTWLCPYFAAQGLQIHVRARSYKTRQSVFRACNFSSEFQDGVSDTIS